MNTKYSISLFIIILSWFSLSFSHASYWEKEPMATLPYSVSSVQFSTELELHDVFSRENAVIGESSIHRSSSTGCTTCGGDGVVESWGLDGQPTPCPVCQEATLTNVPVDSNEYAFLIILCLIGACHATINAIRFRKKAIN